MKKKELSEEIILGNSTVTFDGAEGGCFWIFLPNHDSMEEISIDQAKELVKFLNGWIKRYEES